MSGLIIDGSVSRTKSLLAASPSLKDGVTYVCDEAAYHDVRDVYDLLLREKRYAELKDYNECELLVESAVGQAGRRNYYPMHMQIEHTSYCNARCIMCYHYYQQNRDARHMQRAIYDKVRPWLPYARLVGLHGFGEPFLADQLESYLDEYRTFGVKLYTNTNLAYIPAGLEAYFDDFQFINISCDGATKEVFEGIRQNIGFEAFLDHVRYLRAHAPHTELVFAVVLMRQNMHQCEDIVRLAARLGIDKVTFSKIGINYVIANYEDSADRYPVTLRENLKRALAAGKELGIDVVVPCSAKELSIPEDNAAYERERKIINSIPFWQYSAEEIAAEARKRNDSNVQLENPIPDICFQPTGRKIEGVCDWLTNNIYISATGRVGFCCSNYKHYIGDLNVEPLDDIWQSEKYRRMIEVFQSGRLPYFCKDCNLLKKRMLQGVRELEV